MIEHIHHVQLAMPPVEEVAARTSYAELLGMQEVPKPAELTGRGGVWFTQGAVNLHLGVEQEFRPARKAHPALLVSDLTSLVGRCQVAGVSLIREVPLQGYKRDHIDDPFGNRIELTERIA